MDGATAVITPAQQPQNSRGNQSRRGRSRRGGRGARGGANTEQPQAEVEPPPPQPAGLQLTQSQPTQSRPTPTQPTTRGNVRRFRGQLTTTNPDLRASATSFIPSSVAPPRQTTRPSSKATQPNPTTPHHSTSSHALTKTVSRSSAPDLATRIHEDIAHTIYECAICSNEIGRKSKIWSCNTCWTVFHIGCVKKWSKNEGSAVHNHQSQDHEENIGRLWRCPGCNLPKDVLPSAYSCWCEKEMDPKAVSSIPPHSCGQTCGRDRKFPRACPHPCDQLCHAGPCPPCRSIGPVQSCFCGKQSSTRRCAETEYEAGWSCAEICGDIMPCGEHTCQSPCHEGVCGACTVEVPSTCYCGQETKSIPCNSRSEEKESYAWTGVYNCGNKCGKPLDCGHHKCEQNCHPQDHEIPHCPRSPDVVSTCSCGKTNLSELISQSRAACTDPIPNCEKPCGKALSCGHTCPTTCHTGACNPCFKNVPIKCRCGRESFETPCWSNLTEPPWCMKECRVQLNCSRHQCGERCCPGERLAAQRVSRRSKKQFVDINGANRTPREEFEAEHICTRSCGRPLKCGNHLCADLCHRGPCPTCKEAIFEDISCNCGRTVLQAPLPCGTHPPICNFSCGRSKSCGHPQVAHNCHTDEEDCPKCPFLTEKSCLCAKKTLKNQPCWRADVLCGLICGKLLKCGSHACRKTCHRPGECEDAQLHCQQECGKSKKLCGHPCEQPCHAPAACKEDKSCPFKVIITCDCQRRKEEVRCNVKAGVPDPPGRQTSLKCDDECARLERNRRLATALNIPDDHSDDHIPYSATTLKIYLENATWAHEQEENMRIFAADEDEKRYRFLPMRPRQRQFIHSLGEDFGFDSESIDPEPHRHVHMFKTPKFVAAPMKTLAQAARIRRAQLNIQVAISGATTPERRANEVKPAEYNGLLLKQPRFALTEEELRPAIRAVVPANDFEIIFLSAVDGIALIPKNEWDGQEQIQVLLETLQPIVSSVVSRDGFAVSAILCEFDLDLGNQEPRIVQEAGQSAGMGRAAGGWSQVAAKRSTPMAAPTVAPVGQRSSFTILGSKLAEAKKKKKEDAAMEKRRKALQQEPVVDDWSAEVEREEEEQATSRNQSDREQDDDVANDDYESATETQL